MKFSNILAGTGLITLVVGFMSQTALLGLVPSLFIAAGCFAIAEELKEKL